MCGLAIIMYMRSSRLVKKLNKVIMSVALATVILGTNLMAVNAATEQEEYLAQAEARKSLPIQSDEIENWPAGPKLGCESAMLIEVNTGTVLYEKNIHEQLYPASVTKMLTALIAMEECDLDEMVTYSSEAVGSIDWRQDANLGIKAGDVITMEQSLYGLLVGSANEVAYAIAEHICGPGNVEAFAEKMNKRAEELGCVDSHFVTPNGIHDKDHYTSAHDLALIAQAFYSDELLSKMASTTKYQVPQSPTQPRDDMIVYAKSKLHPGKEYGYEYLVGTKTGYTEAARQTLVSCAEKNGMRLVCVIMKEEAPYQYTDTLELFNYGFDNFKPVNISENDTTYVIQSLNFFSTSSDFFGSSKPILQMNKEDYMIIPVNAGFEDTEAELDYDNLKKGEIARINYSYNGKYVGSARIEPAVPEIATFDFGPRETVDNSEYQEDDVMIINVKTVIKFIAIGTAVVILLIILRTVIKGKINPRRRRGLYTKKKPYKTYSTKNLDWRGFK